MSVNVNTISEAEAANTRMTVTYCYHKGDHVRETPSPCSSITSKREQARTLSTSIATLAWGVLHRIPQNTSEEHGYPWEPATDMGL